MNTAAKVVIAGVASLLALAMCQSRTTGASPSMPPDHQLAVLSVACDPNMGRPRADVAIRNIGTTTLESPQVMVNFGGTVFNGSLRPYVLRPGGTSTATVYANMGGSVNCAVASVQDQDGFTATLAR